MIRPEAVDAVLVALREARCPEVTDDDARAVIVSEAHVETGAAPGPVVVTPVAVMRAEAAIEAGAVPDDQDAMVAFAAISRYRDALMRLFDVLDAGDVATALAFRMVEDDCRFGIVPGAAYREGKAVERGFEADRRRRIAARAGKQKRGQRNEVRKAIVELLRKYRKADDHTLKSAMKAMTDDKRSRDGAALTCTVVDGKYSFRLETRDGTVEQRALTVRAVEKLWTDAGLDRPRRGRNPRQT